VYAHWRALLHPIWLTSDWMLVVGRHTLFERLLCKNWTRLVQKPEAIVPMLQYTESDPDIDLHLRS
jgi:hypothetical protein